MASCHAGNAAMASRHNRYDMVPPTGAVHTPHATRPRAEHGGAPGASGSPGRGGRAGLGGVATTSCNECVQVLEQAFRAGLDPDFLFEIP